MQTIQKTFRWKGDLLRGAVPGLCLRVEYTDYLFEEIFDSNGQISRKKTGAESVEIIQSADDNDYIVSLPVDCLTGAGKGEPALFLRYFKQRLAAFANGSGELNDISIELSLNLLSLDGERLDSSPAHAICFFKNIYDPARYAAVDIDETVIRRHSRDGQQSFIQQNAFLLNASAYEELLSEMRSTAGSGIPADRLLFVIAYFMDLSGPQPKLSAKISPEDLSAAQQILYNLEVPDVPKAIDRIKARIPDLLDFPVSTKNVHLQEVSGTFALKTPDNVALTPADFELYDLSVEYISADEDGQEVQNQLHFDWSSTSRDKITNNAVPFAFSKVRPIFPAKSNETISVYVRSADSLILWSKDFRAGNPALTSLRIEVPLLGPGAVAPSERVVLDNQRLRGQLLDLSKTAVLKDAIVAIQTQSKEDKTWRVVASTTADSAGNFSMAYPFGVFTAAQAVVSLMPESPVDVAVKPDQGDNRTVSDDFLFILLKNPVKAPQADPAVDCDCGPATTPSRLPDQRDLIESGEYMQDLGNGCLNLSTPNRTLREYLYTAIVRTSDPDVTNYTLEKTAEGKYSFVCDNKVIKRRAISLSNPVRWQDAPDNDDHLSFYQTVSVATGHLLHYKSQFRADGYSLGEVLYSLPLAPGQKKQIVIFDQSHTLQGAEAQQLSLTERLAASLINDREISDQLGGTIGEGLRGSSSARTEGVSVGVGVGVSAGYVGASLGVAGGYASSQSEAGQDSARTISQFFNEKLRNGLSQNAEGFRQQNASVITTVSEGQRYSATTEVIANHNHCHSMTMMYFEVLRHYAIYQELANVEECVFVPLLMTNFTKENIYKWQDVLAANLLPVPANTYLPSVGGRHPLAGAFDAIARIKVNYENLDFPAGRYCEEVIRFITGTLQVVVSLPRPKTKYDRILSLPLINTTITHEEFDPEQQLKNILIAPFTFGLSLAGGPAMKTVTETVQVRAQLFDQFMTLDANYGSVPPAQAVRVTNFGAISLPLSAAFFPAGEAGRSLNLAQDRFFDGNELDRRQWEAYGKLLGYDDVFTFLGAYFKGRLISEWDTIFYNDIAPALFEKIIDNLNFSGTKPEKRPTPAAGAVPVNKYPGISADFSSTTRYNGGTVNMTLNVRATSTVKREELPAILYLAAGPAVVNLSDAITFRLENLTLRYTTAHFSNLLFSGYLGDDLQDGTALYMPLTSEDQRYPRHEDQVIANKLIEHLNSNLEYYNKILWYNLDPDRRYLLLDGFNIQVYNDFGVPVGLKSLASVVKNELAAIAGNALVFPVAPGFKVARSYIVEKTETGKTAKVSLLDHYKPLTPMPPYRLSVPTRGVFAEAMMGYCSSCEKVQERTSQDWEKFQTDTPTGINNLTPATAVTTDWKAVFKDLSAPLIALQKAPDAPAPAAGLAGVSDALTKASPFKDITGLDKNQSNAMDTYKANTDAAVKFAEMAKSMAGQAHNTQNSDKIADNLKAAKDSGAITPQEYNALVKKHLEQQIDGGESSKRKEDAEQKSEEKKAAKPTLTDAAVKAADDGKVVKAVEKDKDGNTKSVSVKPAKAPEELPKPIKKYYKTIFFKAIDCYGEIMGAEFHVTVRDVATNQEVGYDEFEHGSGSFRAGFTTVAPTVQFKVVAPPQENAPSPILRMIHFESDPVSIPQAQAGITVTLKQGSEKATIQTKETSLSAEKVLKELGGELSGGTGSKGTTSGSGQSYEVNANIAAKIAGKYAKEVTSTTGHDEGKTFEVVAPVDHYELTVK